MKRDIKTLLSQIDEDALENMSPEELAVVEEALDLVEEEDDGEDDEDEDNYKGSKSKSDDDDSEDDDEDDDDDDDDEDDDDDKEDKKQVKESFTEALGAFMEGISFEEDVESLKAAINEDFTPEDAERVKAILETVHKNKLRQFGEALVDFMSDVFWTQLDESVAAVENYLEEKTDAYMKEAVADWIEANQVEIQEAKEVEAAHGLFESIRSILEDYGMEVVVDADAKDTIAALQEQIETLTTRNDESYEAVMGLNEEVLSLRKQAIIMEQTEGMTDMQRNMIVEYASEIKTDDLDKFASKVNLIVESVGDEMDDADKELAEFVEQFGYEEEDVDTIVEDEDKDGDLIDEDTKKPVDDKVKTLLEQMTPRH